MSKAFGGNVLSLFPTVEEFGAIFSLDRIETTRSAKEKRLPSNSRETATKIHNHNFAPRLLLAPLKPLLAYIYLMTAGAPGALGQLFSERQTNCEWPSAAHLATRLCQPGRDGRNLARSARPGPSHSGA